MYGKTVLRVLDIYAVVGMVFTQFHISPILLDGRMRVVPLKQHGDMLKDGAVRPLLRFALNLGLMLQPDGVNHGFRNRKGIAVFQLDITAVFFAIKDPGLLV